MPTYDEDESVDVMDDDRPAVPARRAVTKRAVRKTAARRVSRRDEDNDDEFDCEDAEDAPACAKPDPEHMSIPNDAKHPDFLAIVHRRIRDLVAQAMTQAEHDFKMVLAEVVQIKVEQSLNNPAYVGFSTEFNPEHFRVGIIGGRTLNLRELTRQQSRTLSHHSKNERTWYTLFGDSILPETFTPDQPLDLQNGHYPSARHLYFTLETLSDQEGYNADGECIDFRFHLEDRSADFEVTVHNLANGPIQMLNGNGWSRRAVYRLSHTSALRYSSHVSGDRKEFGHLDVLYSEVEPQIVVPITVDQLLSDDTDELFHYVKSIIATNNSAFTRDARGVRDPENAVRFVTGLYIEGVHWNKHRRSEIEHMIVESPHTLMEEISAITRSEVEDPASFHDINSKLTDGFEAISPLVFGRMREPASGVLLGGKHLLCPTSLDAQMLLRCIEEATKPSPEKMRELAIKQAVAHRDQAYQDKLKKAYGARQRLIEAELEVAQALEARDAFARSLNGALDQMHDMFKAMDIFIDVQMSSSLRYLLTTGDIYGTYPSVYDDEVGAEESARHKFAKRRYLGQYQIMYEPLTGGMSVRNIAAPMALESKLPNHRNQETACAVFHPHSSIESEYGYTDVCLSSYGAEIGKTLRNKGGSIADIAFNQIRSALLFLQTYSMSDSYVGSLLTAMPETRPEQKYLGVTAWQTFSQSDGRQLDFSGFNFKGYPSPKASPTLVKIDPDVYRWPEVLERSKASKLKCPILQFVSFDDDSVESIGLHQMLLRSDPEVAAAIERFEASMPKKPAVSTKKNGRWMVVEYVQNNTRRARNDRAAFAQAVAVSERAEDQARAEVAVEVATLGATVTLSGPAFAAYSNNESSDSEGAVAHASQGEADAEDEDESARQVARLMENTAADPRRLLLRPEDEEDDEEEEEDYEEDE